jgi:hypothetical protein
LEQTEKFAHTLAAIVRGFDASDRTAPDDNPILDLLDEQIAQREDLFAFGVVERIYDRGLVRIDALSNRIGILIAAQVAVEAVLIDKAGTFARGPDLLMFAAIVATALLLRATGEPDSIDADAFVGAFGDRPWQTRDALTGRLRAAIARNRHLCRSRRRLFAGTLLVTIVVLGWAFW